MIGVLVFAAVFLFALMLVILRSISKVHEAQAFDEIEEILDESTAEAGQ